ncbi:MAG: TetR/AcrR family transcriptional regulator [Akkermansia sp.]|nr:TetR/AcrR family transcriptional regulator [Akkermansia sp.]MBQ7023700.1 TetR/AcrR family transcriptional regulator [Akkermansia sp.]
MDIRAEERLIEIGQQWLKHGGVRGMKLRRICAEAELSPGTFTAYFPTLGEFKKKVLDNWYTPLQTEVNRIEKIEGNAKERLRTILLAVMRFFRPNAGVMIQLLLDASAGEQVVSDFLQKLQGNHIFAVRRALLEAQAAGAIEQAPVEQQMFYLVGAVNMPVMFYHLLPDNMPIGTSILDSLGNAVSEEMTLQRLDWALKGISL